MKITLLLVLVLLVTAAWVALSVVREQAISRNAYVQQTLMLHTHSTTLHDMHMRHNEALRKAMGFEDVQQPQVEPPKLPEWIHQYIKVEEDDGWFAYGVKSNIGGFLTAVPALWFHASFAVIHALLIFLCFVLIYTSKPGG